MKKRNVPTCQVHVHTHSYTHTNIYTYYIYHTPKKLFSKVDTNMWATIIRINQLGTLPKTMKYSKIKFCLVDSYMFWITELAFACQVREQILAQNKWHSVSLWLNKATNMHQNIYKCSFVKIFNLQAFKPIIDIDLRHEIKWLQVNHGDHQITRTMTGNRPHELPCSHGSHLNI